MSTQPIAATEPIMPCPFCKGECTLIADSPADLPVFYYADCSGGCGYSSKIEDVATEAIAAHNALCSAEARGYERGVRDALKIFIDFPGAYPANFGSAVEYLEHCVRSLLPTQTKGTDQ